MALELLDANFGDEEVRAYAVARVDTLPDADVIDYMVQLVQVLKYEPYHDSALARMLLRRALRSRLVGHHFFWHLRAEMHQLDIQVRFALLLEAYLRGAPAHMETLQTQNTALSALYNAATTIKGVKSAERADVLAAELSKIKFPPSFQIALNPRYDAAGRRRVCRRCTKAHRRLRCPAPPAVSLPAGGRRRAWCSTSASTWTRKRCARPRRCSAPRCYVDGGLTNARRPPVIARRAAAAVVARLPEQRPHGQAHLRHAQVGR